MYTTASYRGYAEIGGRCWSNSEISEWLQCVMGTFVYKGSHRQFASHIQIKFNFFQVGAL